MFVIRLFAFSLLILQLSAVAPTQIVLKPAGNSGFRLRPKSLDVRAKIHEGIAEMTLTYVFANPVDQDVEAEFMYTLPPDTVATGFAYWYGEEKVVARIAEKERAAAIYQHITSRMRDPALIEMIGKRAFRAKIFPVMPEADLKIEMTLVQVLRNDVFSLPLTVAKQAFQSLQVAIEVDGTNDTHRIENNLGLASSADGGKTKLSLSASNFRPNQPLRIRVSRNSAESGIGRIRIYGGLSGGPEGFFTLVFIPATSLPKATFEWGGIEAFSVHGPSRANLTPGNGLVWTGRYRHRTGNFIVKSGGKQFGFPVSFAAEPIPNHPATAYWAFDEIEARTQKKDRAAVLALSHRFGMPSKYTSWIAIPEEERKRYRIEKAQAEIELVTPRLLEAYRKDPNSAQTIALRNKISEIATGAGLDPKAGLRGAFYPMQYEVGSEYGKALFLGKPTQALLEKWKAIGRLIGEDARTPTYYADSAANDFAADLVKDAEKYRPGVRPKIEVFLARARQAGLDGREILRENARWTAVQAASEAYSAERARKMEIAKRHEAKTQRMVDLFGLDPAEVRRSGREQVLANEYYHVASRLAHEVSANLPNSAEAQKYREALRKLMAEAGSKRWTAVDYLGWQQTEVFREWLEIVAQGKEETTEGKALRARVDNLNEAMADDQGIYLKRQAEYLVRSDAYELGREQAAARRNFARIADLEKRGRNLAAWSHTDWEALMAKTISETGYYYPEGKERRAFLDALRGPGTPSEISAARERFRQATHRTNMKTYADDRVERIEVEVQLERLSQRQPTAEEKALIAQLEKRRDELRARMGDPMIRVQAPPDARVIAKFPDGSTKALRWNDAKQIWEANFDIPPNAPEGVYRVLVTILNPLGIARFETFEYAVDLTAPRVHAFAYFRNGRLQIEIESDEDAARAEVFVTDVDRHTLTPLGHGRFATTITAADVPDKVAVVVFDKAHNRSFVLCEVQR